MIAKLVVDGSREIADALMALGKKAARSIIRKGLRAGGKIVKSVAQADAPKGMTGLLRRNIKVRAGKSKKGSISINVGVGAKDFTGKAFYAAFVLYGHRAGSRKLGDARKFVPGNNFLLRAHESTSAQVIETVSDTWLDLIEQAAASKASA